MADTDLKYLFEKFQAAGSYKDCCPTGSGHIHDTWLIRTVEQDKPDYILQKINHNVFPPVAEMMENIRKVTNHISKKRDAGSPGKVLEIIETKSNKSYFTDPEGNYWRMYRKITPGISYDVVPNINVAYEAGRAFGQFIRELSDLPAEEIFPVIPEFNSMEMRFGQFKDALEANPVNRVAEVKEEIDFVYSHIDDMLVITSMGKEGKLPLRITHNDTKLNNIIFDSNDKAVSVIDLDTVMPGLALYDFGDTIRTAANTAEEDEADTEKIRFSLPVFKAYSEGFLESTISFLTPSEIEYLPLSAQYMTFIMGLRFLTDYIAGDVYYSIKYPDQNLRRCRAQFRLMDCMSDSYNETNDIILESADAFKNF
jgi:hypothetical protein